MMQRLILVAALAAASTAVAQQPQRPSDEELNARIQALSAQRNAAQDQVVLLSGQAQAEIAKLHAEIDRLKKACGDACKPKDSPTKQ